MPVSAAMWLLRMSTTHTTGKTGRRSPAHEARLAPESQPQRAQGANRSPHLALWLRMSGFDVQRRKNQASENEELRPERSI